MKEYRTARILAETYVFGDKQTLTERELHVIEKSPFKNVLEIQEQTTFGELYEKQIQRLKKDTLIQENDSTTKTHHVSKSNRYITGVSRDEIIELIRSIEDEFQLEVPYNYNKLEVEALKEFIKKYSERHIFDDQTKNLVLKVADKEHPEEIMGGLRVYIGR